MARQYTGTAGKRENSQVATVLSYATKDTHVFLDRRLYLPEAWAWDRTRRQEARVPEEVRFATKPEQAMAMLSHAWEQGVPMRWVTGDEVYGDAPRLRERIQEQGRYYVLAVSANTRVWTERPEVEEPKAQTGGRPRLAPRVVKGAPKARMVSEVVASLPKSAWKRLAVVEGEKGLITSHWARVVESRDRLPGPDVWLLARRSPSAPEKPAYYLAYAPTKTSLSTLVPVASSRYTVEQCIEEAKGDTGLMELIILPQLILLSRVEIGQRNSVQSKGGSTVYVSVKSLPARSEAGMWPCYMMAKRIRPQQMPGELSRFLGKLADRQLKFVMNVPKEQAK